MCHWSGGEQPFVFKILRCDDDLGWDELPNNQYDPAKFLEQGWDE